MTIDNSPPYDHVLPIIEPTMSSCNSKSDTPGRADPVRFGLWANEVGRIGSSRCPETELTMDWAKT